VDAWVWWLVAAGVLALVEVTTLSLVCAMFAGGALAAAVVDLIGGDRNTLLLQVVAFVVVSVGLLGVIRPVAKRHLHHTPAIATGVAALIGSRAVVLERVDRDTGRVRIGGEVWSARSYDGETVLEPGQSVDVIRIDGATALVL
jgi:membrane protein implicated in regulation of membrane protease activity